MFRRIACVLALCVSSLPADEAVQPSLTIYNQNFAVVRQELPLNLKAGPNRIQVTDITMHLEPDSVILRDPSGKHPLQVLEQNYRADPISESLLLSLNEGKTIDFLVQRENKQEVVTGKIIRSGYTPHNYMAMNLSHSSPLGSVWRGRPRPRKAEGLSSFGERRNSERS